MSAPVWISAHFFYHDNLDRLLMHYVQPLVETLRQRRAIQRYFFLRYWQGGPHVRLRLLPRPGVSASLLRQRIAEQAQQFVTRYPAQQELQVTQYQQLSAQLSQLEYRHQRGGQLYPNNTLVFIPYVPEYRRFGGAQALSFVQQHFMESSDLVLGRLGLSRDQRSGQALAALLLAGALAVESPLQLAALFERHFLGWARLLGDAQPAYLGQFQRQYEHQRRQIHQLVPGLLRLVWAPQAGQPQPALQRWVSSLRTLRAQIQQIEQRGALQRYGMRGRGAALLPSLLLDCAHLHSNRLGLMIHEEVYLKFLLKQALAELSAAQLSTESLSSGAMYESDTGALAERAHLLSRG